MKLMKRNLAMILGALIVMISGAQAQEKSKYMGGEVKTTGNQNELLKLIDMFDKFESAKNHMVPPKD